MTPANSITAFLAPARPRLAGHTSRAHCNIKRRALPRHSARGCALLPRCPLLCARQRRAAGTCSNTSLRGFGTRAKTELWGLCCCGFRLMPSRIAGRSPFQTDHTARTFSVPTYAEKQRRGAHYYFPHTSLPTSHLPPATPPPTAATRYLWPAWPHFAASLRTRIHSPACALHSLM